MSRRHVRRHRLRTRRHVAPWRRRMPELACERLESRRMLVADEPLPVAATGAYVHIPAEMAAALDWSTAVSEVDLASGQNITVPRSGSLVVGTASGAPLPVGLRLTLRDATDTLVVDLTTDGDGRRPLLRQFLTAGTYRLGLEGDIPLDACFVLRFQPSESPVLPIFVGDQPTCVVSKDMNGDPIDLNGDGIDDLVVARVVYNFFGIEGGGQPADAANAGGLTILEGVGDGGFRIGASLRVGVDPQSVAVGPAVKGQSQRLIVTANTTSDNVTVLRQEAGGAFREVQPPISVGLLPSCVALGDANSDGLTDIVVANSALVDISGLTPNEPGSVSVILQQQDGTFVVAYDIRVGSNPQSVAIGNMNDDSLPDIVVVNGESSDVSVLLRRPEGGFRESATRPAVGLAPAGVAIADIDGDRRLDIVVANSGAGTISILVQQPALADHDVTFRATEHRVGGNPYAVLVANIDADKQLDIVATNQNSNTVSVLYGCTTARTFTTGSYPSSVATVVQENSRVDLATANTYDGTVTLLRGLGGDAAVGRDRTTAGDYPYGLSIGDVDGDDREDVVTVNYDSRDVSVLIGRGDGTYATKRTFSLGLGPQSPRPEKLVVVDLNVDGRADILVTASGLPDNAAQPTVPGAVLVLYGLGDGTFAEPISLARDGEVVHPVAIAVADLDGNRLPDIVFATFVGDDAAAKPDDVDELHVLIQQPDGLFADHTTPLVRGVNVGAVVLSDMDLDGAVDIVLSCQGGGNEPGAVLVFSGDGGGGIRDVFALPDGGNHPRALAVTDIDGDGRPDVVAVNVNEVSEGQSGDVSIWTQPETRQFVARLPRPAVGVFPRTVSVADLDGDKRSDIVVTHTFSGSIGVLLATDGGLLLPVQEVFLGVGALPADVVTADVDGDSRTDIVTANAITNDVSVLVAASGFAVGADAVILSNAASREVAGLSPTGGASGTVTVDRRGVVQVRGSTPNDTADSNADVGGGVFALTVVPVADGSIRIASIDNDRRTLVVWAGETAGTLREVQRLSAASDVQGLVLRTLLSRILSVDVDGNGWGDLLVSNPGAGSIDILVANADGSFDDSMWQLVSAGAGTTEILLEDVDGDDVADLLGVNQLSGDISVRYGVAGALGMAGFDAAVAFGEEHRVRASALPYGFGVDPYSRRETVIGPSKLLSIAVGDVTDDDRTDLVAINDRACSFTIMSGLATGGFSAPQSHLVRVPLTLAPCVATAPVEVQDVTVGDFDADGRSDIALLDRPGERILLYASRANPTYEKLATVISLAGNVPRSLRVADSVGPNGRPDGVLDIIVGNDFGDVLVLQGKADATGRGTGEFQTCVRADKSIALMAADIDGDGRDDFIYGNKGLDRVTMSRSATQESFAADQSAGVIGPSAVATVVETVGGREMKNLLVANGGANQIMLFSRNPAAASDSPDIFLPPQRFFVGSNPSAVAVADVDKDGIPDVIVANAGSNDVSVMRGAIGMDGRWTMIAGPRLAAGGTSPAGVAVGDFVTGSGLPGKDGIPDIAVTNRGSGSANILTGRSGGFFNDGLPVPLVLPPNAQPGPITSLGNGLAIGNIGAGSITIVDFSRFGAGADLFTSRTYASGGSSPSSLASFSSGGTIYLAVGNVSGSVSLFLGRPGSLDFSLQTSFAMPGITGLAFDSAGQLFGMSPGRDSALQLFAFDGQSSSAATPTGAGLAALGAAVYYVPLRASAVALVATIVSSGAIVAGEGDAKPAAASVEQRNKGDGADGGVEEGDGKGEEDADAPKEPAAAERTESDAVDAAAAGVIDFFLDLENALRANNDRLLQSLLDGTPEGDAAPGAAEDRTAPATPALGQGAGGGGGPEPIAGRHAVWRHWADLAVPDPDALEVYRTHGEAASDPQRRQDAARGIDPRGIDPSSSVMLVSGAAMMDRSSLLPATILVAPKGDRGGWRRRQRRRRGVARPAQPGLFVGCKPPR